MNLGYFFKKRQLFFGGVFLAAIVTFFDLYSKQVIFSFLDEYALNHSLEIPQIKIFDFFSLVKVLNFGVSFGMFNEIENSQIIFSFLQSSIAFVLLIWLYFKAVGEEFIFTRRQIYFTIAVALIIGGALGNSIDRIQNGAVADFLDFHLFEYHWPAFNLADSCVCIGVFMLIFEDMFFGDDSKKLKVKPKNKKLQSKQSNKLKVVNKKVKVVKKQGRSLKPQNVKTKKSKNKSKI